MTRTILNDDELKKEGLFEQDFVKKNSAKKPWKMYKFKENNSSFGDYEKFMQNQGGGSSNSWVIKGEHTKSGMPIFANDPHLEPMIPTTFHIAEVWVGEEFIFGGGTPGIPFLNTARNNHVSWGVTTNNIDISDLYEEKIEGDKYLFKDEWLPLRIKKEVLKIKDQPDVEFEVWFTHHGPVLDYVNSFFNNVNHEFASVSIEGDFSFAWSGYE